MLGSISWDTPGGGGGGWGRGPGFEPEPQQWRRGRRSPKAEHFPEIIAQGHHLGAPWRVELAQAAATQPSAGSASPCRDRTRPCGRPESNATRIKTIHRHWRRFQAHRLLRDFAFARPPGRRAQQARRNRHGGTPKRNNSKRHGSSAHSNPQRRHVTRQKASCLLPPPAGQQSRAEKLQKLGRICATVSENYE